MTDFPATTAEQARALLATPALQPVTVDGFELRPVLVEAGVGRAIVNGKWETVRAYEVSFEGGRWGSHTLRCSVSSPERIRAHWEGYIAAHQQHAERVKALKSVPAGKTFVKPTAWHPKAGDRCFFTRGMFGLWQGTIKRIYTATRGGFGIPKGTVLVDIAFTGANGQHYVARRVPARTISKNGIHPTIERT